MLKGSWKVDLFYSLNNILVGMSKSGGELTELELRIATLIRKYNEQRDALRAKQRECEDLQSLNSVQEKKIHRLEQDLSIAAVTKQGTPNARVALEDLDRELAEMTTAIDECITLLEGRIE